LVGNWRGGIGGSGVEGKCRGGIGAAGVEGPRHESLAELADGFLGSHARDEHLLAVGACDSTMLHAVVVVLPVMPVGCALFLVPGDLVSGRVRRLIEETGSVTEHSAWSCRRKQEV
jgi:hypothetical protein